jgi:hypothetical protein
MDQKSNETGPKRNLVAAFFRTNAEAIDEVKLRHDKQPQN